MASLLDNRAKIVVESVYVMVRISRKILSRLLATVTEGTRPVTEEDIEHIATLLFLAILDGKEAKRESASAPDDAASAASLFPQQAARYRWSRWRQLRGSKLREFVNVQVLRYMASLITEAPQIAEYFRGATLLIDESVLETLVDEINGMNIDRLPVQQRRTILNDLFVHLDTVASRKRGRFHLPPALRKLMIELLAPQPGATIFDPACRCGELLADAGAHVQTVDPPVANQNPTTEVGTLAVTACGQLEMV